MNWDGTEAGAIAAIAAAVAATAGFAVSWLERRARLGAMSEMQARRWALEIDQARDRRDGAQIARLRLYYAAENRFRLRAIRVIGARRFLIAKHEGPTSLSDFARRLEFNRPMAANRADHSELLFRVSAPVRPFFSSSKTRLSIEVSLEEISARAWTSKITVTSQAIDWTARATDVKPSSL
jgi:hypothetical protein